MIVLSTLRRALALLSRRDRIRFRWLIVISLIMAALEVVGIGAILPFVAMVADPEIVYRNPYLLRIYEQFEMDSPEQLLRWLTYLLIAILVSRNVFFAFAGWWTTVFAARSRNNLARKLLGTYILQPYEWYLRRSTVELRRRVLQDSGRVLDTVVLPSAQLMTRACVASAILVLLTMVNPIVSFIVAGVLTSAYVGVYLALYGRLQGMGEQMQELSQRRFKGLSEGFGAIKELKLLGREDVYLRRFDADSRDIVSISANRGLATQLPRHFIEVIAISTIAVFVATLVDQGNSGSEILPLVALYTAAGYRLLPAFQNIYANVSALRFGEAALNKISEDLELNNSSRLSNQVRDNSASLPFRKEIELRNLSFTYSESNQMILQSIDLTISRGQSIGIIGKSGSGKTTLADLMLGLLTPTAGSILVDGTRITPENSGSWQRNIGYVPQHIYLSDQSICQNIALGISSSKIDIELVIRSARIANLHEFITEELEDGYDTVVGERGLRLSGGQRQRIGIARALYHSPSFLVLDEATSALDGFTEKSVMNGILELPENVTTIIVAHRTSTLKTCDSIWVLENGRIAGSGTYSELAASGHVH